MKQLALLALGLLLLWQGPLPPPAAAADEPSSYGTAVSIGSGTARTYVTWASDKSPRAVGVEFSPGAMDNLLPAADDGRWCFNVDGKTGCRIGHQYDLQLPGDASVAPFTYVQLNWNPNGHTPVGVYDIPHFDFHFYMAPQSRVESIKPGACGLDMGLVIDCEGLRRGRLNLSPQLMPAGYINVGVVEAAMGNHLINPAAPEFNRTRFTRTFIHGTFDGSITFSEPMITREFLLTRSGEACQAIAQPKAYDRNGWYPTTYCVRGSSGAVMVSLEGFVRHDERNKLIADLYMQRLCRTPDSEALRTWDESNLGLSHVDAVVNLSPEGRRANGIRGVYLGLLGRDPIPSDCGGLLSWMSSELSLEEIQQRLMDSSEYMDMHPPVD